MLARSKWTALVLGWILIPGVAVAGEFTPVSQSRSVHSDTINSTTGYTCLNGILPSCPVDLGTTTPSDDHAASNFAPWSAEATTTGGSSSQNSVVGVTSVIASGSSSADASAEVLTEPGYPPYILVLSRSDPSTRNDFSMSFDLDVASNFSFLASGEIVYPDPSFPLVWDASLQLELSGPSGVVATLEAVVDSACTPDTEMLCTVTPTPITMSGVLPPGAYNLTIELVTSAGGSWLPSPGAMSGLASGSYDVSLQLTPTPSVPALSVPALWLLALGLAGLGLLGLGSRRLLR